MSRRLFLAVTFLCTTGETEPNDAYAQLIVRLPGTDHSLGVLEDGLEEIYRIGGASSTGWDAFGSVDATAFTPDGDLVVLDRRVQRIVLVDTEGNHVRDIGRRGDGPGEFAYAGGMVVGIDGDIVVHDYAKQAFIVYSHRGVVRTIIRKVGSSRARDIRASRLNDVLLSMRETADTRFVDQVTLSGDTAVRKPLWGTWRPAKQHPDGVVFVMEGTREGTDRGGSAEVFFPPLLYDALPGGGLALIDSSSYAVKIVDGSGQLAKVLVRPILPAPVTRAVRRAERDRLRTEAAERWTSPRIKDAWMRAIDRMRFFPEIPVIVEMRTSWEGRIWLRRHGGVASSDGSIDVLTVDGQYVGTYDWEGNAPDGIPEAFGPRGMAAFVEVDQLGAESIVVRRLPDVVR